MISWDNVETPFYFAFADRNQLPAHLSIRNSHALNLKPDLYPDG